MVTTRVNSGEADQLARATREARNAARLRKHENIVAIHDIVVEDGLPWIVMDLIDGCSLSEHLEAHGPLSVDAAAAVAAALLGAVGAAHREGVVHRDIKPANVMLANGGKVLLTDFGTAVHSTDTTLTVTGMVIGSPEYTAPERLRGTDGLPASDLFSLGATLFRAVEGVSPFRRDTPTATLSAVLMDPVPAPRRAGPLTPLVMRLLDKDPARRPAVQDALTMARLPGERPTVHVTTNSLPRDTRIIPARGDTRRPTGWRGAGEVLVALGAVLGIIGFMGPDIGLGWESLPYAMRFCVVLDAVLAGVLCAGVVRLVPASVDRTATVFVGVAGFLFGAGATFAAVIDFLAYTYLRIAEGRIVEDTAWAAAIVITVVLLVAVGWGLISRKGSNGTATGA